MLQFKVSGLSCCGSCVPGVTRAIQSEYPSAAVEIDPSAQLVKVDGVSDAAGVARLIEGAGYPVLGRATL